MITEKKITAGGFKKFLPVLISGILWLVGFTYGTGFGHSINIYGKTVLVVTAVFFVYFIFGKKYRSVSLDIFLIFCFAALINIYYFIRFGQTQIEYLCMFFILPVMGALPLEKKQMTFIGLMFFIGGMVILAAANFTSILSGWDGNSISMPAFFSFTVFAAAFGEIRQKKKIIFFIAASLVYFFLLLRLNSRSSIIFSIFLVLSVFSVIPTEKPIRNRSFFILLFTPLVIALIFSTMRDAEWIESLNEWSARHFGKAFVNGRDELCRLGFGTWLSAPLFGTGSFSGNWHNSAVTLLAGGGIVGYALYLYVVAKILKKSAKHADDGIVRGLILAYSAIWLQQSFELGLVAPQGNAIPFAVLGLMLARTKTLEDKNELQTVNNNSGV